MTIFMDTDFSCVRVFGSRWVSLLGFVLLLLPEMVSSLGPFSSPVSEGQGPTRSLIVYIVVLL